MQSNTKIVERIWIEPYLRLSRSGKLVHVRGHWRRLPGRRKSATVITFPNSTVA